MDYFSFDLALAVGDLIEDIPSSSNAIIKGFIITNTL